MTSIKKVKIENFRNIKSLEFEVSKTAIISGKNGLGKSSALNSLMWFFTDTIYTDNAGVGENDIQSIVPKNAAKGEYTSVTVTFDTDIIFKKIYKTGYDRTTGKANKHATEGQINGVTSKNIQEWYKELYQVVNFESVFTSVKEVNLFVDPMYALQKLDAKQLRLLLVSMGCQVTNEELYRLGFDDLKQYESKYLGNFANMRANLKQQIKEANLDVTRYETLLSQYNEIEEFNDKTLNALTSKIGELRKKQAMLHTTDKNLKIESISNQIKELELKRQEEKNALMSNYKAKISNMVDQCNQLKLEQQTKYNNLFSKYDISLEKLANEEQQIYLSIQSSEKSISYLRDLLKNAKAAAGDIQIQKKALSKQLLENESKKFDGYITCPCCGQTFPQSQDALEHFNSEKENKKNEILLEITKNNDLIAKYDAICKDYVTSANTLKGDISKLNERLAALKEEKQKIEEIKSSIELPEIPELAELEKSKALTQNELFDIENNNFKSKYDEEITNLKVQLEELEQDNKKTNKILDEQIEQDIVKLEEEKAKEYVNRSNWQFKVEYQKDYDMAITKVNDLESLLQRVNDFIHTMIEKVNQKAKVITGIDFVMIEENLSNDNVKEVCYAVIDGIPFANVNTAKKFEIGIKFIEKAKEIANKSFGKKRNNLPILADKLEGIDNKTRIATLTQEQLICTRVTEDEKITIIL